ncbi:DUF4129 domain-containing protein [Halorubrum sp. Atlit-28R]|nr:DUF4129 domain-containing protein [Halorubrum sp. Atlit-28R]
MSRRVRRFAVFATVMLLVGGVAVGAGATAPAPIESGNETAPDSPPSHQNPTNVTESGDSQQVARYLNSQLVSRLNASALAVSDEEYAKGQQLLGADYDLLLEQYGAVAAGTDTEQIVTRFNLTREQQREIINKAQQLNQTATLYQAAVRNGDDERARALARDIVENASELNASTATLNEQYANLETQTNLSFETTQEAIVTNQRRLTQAAGAIASREFTETNVSVQTAQPNLSAASPTQIHGRLVAANGTPVTNATVEIAVGDDTITTQTDSVGRYTTSYQPLLVSSNISTLTASYRPASGDPFLSSTATTSISVTGQQPSTLSVTNATTSAGFGDPLRVSGDVNIHSVENRSLAGLPVVLQIGERKVATGSTTANGSYTLATTLPETIAPGEYTVRVRLAADGLTVAPTVAMTQLTVQSTPTELSVETNDTETDSENISITGTLTTDTGDPLADRTLQLQLGSVPFKTVRTDSTGQYQATIDRASVQDEDTRVLTVQFAASGSNLESSTAEQTLSLSATNPGRQLVLVAGLLFVLIMGGLLVIREQFTTQWAQLRNSVSWDTDDKTETSVNTDETEAGRLAVADIPDETTSADSMSLRERAQNALNAGDPDAAVQFAYAAFRNEIRSPIDRSQTHWEVYNQWRATDQSEAAAVRQLTTAYEQATFASEPVSVETAQKVVELLPSLTETSGLPQR